MPVEPPNFPDAPVLILAPTGNDAHNAAEVLGKVNIRAEICGTMQDLCSQAGEQTGAFLVTEESLDTDGLVCLVRVSDPAAAVVEYPDGVIDNGRGNHGEGL
jgi:hypothetical protein